jgi:hypothetical protein
LQCNQFHPVLKKPFIFIFTLVLLVQLSAQAQQIVPADIKALKLKEDTLKALAKNVIIDSFTAGRMRSDSQFVKTLVRGLQVKNSFYFPFDSVKGIFALLAGLFPMMIFTPAKEPPYNIKQRMAACS